MRKPIWRHPEQQRPRKPPLPVTLQPPRRIIKGQRRQYLQQHDQEIRCRKQPDHICQHPSPPNQEILRHRIVIPVRHKRRPEPRLAMKNDRPEVPVLRRLERRQVPLHIRPVRLDAVLDRHAPGLGAPAIINRAPDRHADHRQRRIPHKLQLRPRPRTRKRPPRSRLARRFHGLHRLAIRSLGRGSFTSFSHGRGVC